MSRSRLFLSGIKAEGRHGAREGEKDSPQPFVVDLDLEVDPVQDRIEATADYREIVEGVRGVVERTSFDLIETLAAEIARWCLGLEHVSRATVVVHKPAAAGRLGIDGVAAAVTLPED